MSNPKLNFKFIDQINNIDLEVKKRLSQYLSGVVTGNDSIYYTPLGKDNDPEVILKEWDSIFESNKRKINQNLHNLEALNRSKFGPRSISKPWSERESSLLSYFEKDKCRYSAEELVSNSPYVSNLRPISIENAVKYLRNSTSSGLPYLIKKGLVKDRVVSKFKQLLDQRLPCILFTRTQESGKTRDVWGYPIADTLNEMTVYQPLLGFQKKLDWRAALRSPNDVDIQLTDMLKHAVSKGYYLVSIDFEGYDKSVLLIAQRASFSYISKLFQKSAHQLIDNLFERFNTIGIVTPSGIKEGAHGVPSGSTFTNEVDSIAQFLMALKSRVIIKGKFQIQGDDGCYVIKTLSDVNKLFKSFELGGLKVNRDKSYVSKDHIVYLQCLYDIHYERNGLIGGIYPTYRALNRLIYQERYSDFEDFQIKGQDYYSIRALSILENCKYHPLFKEIVLFVKKYDKYSLQFSQEGLNKYNSMIKETNGTVGVIMNQYGDDTRGIRSFQSYKLVNNN